MDTAAASQANRAKKRKRPVPLEAAIERQTVTLEVLDKLPGEYDPVEWAKVYNSNVDKANFNFGVIEERLNWTCGRKVDDLIDIRIDGLTYDKDLRVHSFEDEDDDERFVTVKWSEIEKYVLVMDYSKLLRVLAPKFFSVAELCSYDRLNDNRLSTISDYIIKVINSYIKNSRSSELLKHGIYKQNYDSTVHALTSAFATYRSDLRKKEKKKNGVSAAQTESLTDQ